MNDTTVDHLLFQLKSISHKNSEIDKKPHEFGTGMLMYHSEMYLIEILGSNEGQSMTKIAEIMGITKGAVSQTFKKLDNKCLVKKYPDPSNASRSLLYLNSDGRKLLNTHKRWHEMVDGGFSEYLKGLEASEAFIIKDFLSRYEFFLDNRIE